MTRIYEGKELHVSALPATADCEESLIITRSYVGSLRNRIKVRIHIRPAERGLRIWISEGKVEARKVWRWEVVESKGG